MKSGQQIARENIAKFDAWVEEREKADDWKDYVRNDKLNRSEIAAECGFALSVLRQNPAVKEALQVLEKDLVARRIIPSQPAFGASNAAAEASNKVADKRVMAAKAKVEARAKTLEEQNASLKAEVRDLREQLRRFAHMEDHLGRTGRLLPQ
ncbi:MAG: VPA1267 family protein [Desulfobacterales bacterium]|nr:VPA1267 family protein [Desulfobacterales bacterium]